VNLPEHVIREAKRADVPAMALLAAEFAQYMRALGDTTDFHLDASALERDGFGPNPAFGALVAEKEGAIVGYLHNHDGYDSDDACRLLVVADLFVTRTARGRGVVAALMREATAVAARRGAKEIVWTVDRRPVRAGSSLDAPGRVGSAP